MNNVPKLSRQQNILAAFYFNEPDYWLHRLSIVMVPLLVGNTAAPSRTLFSDWKVQKHKERPLEYMFNAEKKALLSSIWRQRVATKR
jgi:hypothetical protein